MADGVLPGKDERAEPPARKGKLHFEGAFGVLGIRCVSWHHGTKIGCCCCSSSTKQGASLKL